MNMPLTFNIIPALHFLSPKVYHIFLLFKLPHLNMFTKCSAQYSHYKLQIHYVSLFPQKA